MNRKYRFVLYFLLCLSILTFPYIAEICIDVWVWLSKTIDTNCLIVSLCIAGIFLFMEFRIHTCKKEKRLYFFILSTRFADHHHTCRARTVMFLTYVHTTKVHIFSLAPPPPKK